MGIERVGWCWLKRCWVWRARRRIIVRLELRRIEVGM